MNFQDNQNKQLCCKGAGATGVAGAAAPLFCPCFARAYGGMQKVPFGHAQKCLLKNEKIIIKNLETVYS